MLKKHPFLFYFETCEERVVKAFSLLQRVQFSHSVLSDCLCNMDCSTPGFPVLHHLPELAQTRVHWVGDAIWPSYPLLSPSTPSFNLSQHQVFSNDLALCIRWPKYQSFSFSINLSNEYLGLISFRIGWFDLLAVRGTLKSLLQHHSSKASILWKSAFFMVQLLYPYMTTIALSCYSLENLSVGYKVLPQPEFQVLRALK